MAAAGCRCQRCWGFREAIEQITGREHSELPRAPGCGANKTVVVGDGARRAVRPDPLEKPCDGSMTCGCSRCVRERRSRRVREVRQPWEPLKRAA